MVYSNLKAVIISKYGSFSEFSKILNITEEKLMDKLNCIIDFTLEEVELILSSFSFENYDFLFYKENYYGK